MNATLGLAFRSLTKKGYNNGIKIISLGVGLAIGLVMIAKACFEGSYNDFYPDVERIVYITGATSLDDDRYHPVSGAIGETMMYEIPEVEVSTRYRWLDKRAVFFTEEQNRLQADVVFGDSCLFEVLARPMVAGNAGEVLARPRYALISAELAQRFGDASAVVGQTIRLDKYPSVPLVIGGIFATIPDNTTESFDVVISMASLGLFTYDGSHRWRGNSEFHTFAKLRPGVDPAAITRTTSSRTLYAPSHEVDVAQMGPTGSASSALSPLDIQLNEMIDRHLDQDIVEKTGVKMYHWALPFQGKHTDDVGVRILIAGLILFAFLILFVAVMNYVLVVLSSIISRSKDVAVRKCYGAGKPQIARMLFAETSVHLSLALLLAGTLLFACRGYLESLFQHQLQSLLTPASALILLGVCLLVLLVAGFLPAQWYGNIPIAVAFRNYTESRRRWKLVLLCCQFACTTFLFTLLMVVILQYGKLETEEVGYDHDNIVFCDTQGISDSDRRKVMEALRRMPAVTHVATCSAVPCSGPWSGNDVMLVGSSYQLFQIDDFYAVDAYALPLLGIQMIDGTPFIEGQTEEREILVSAKFATLLAQTAGWTGSVVGREIFVTSHGECLIRGVYKEIRSGESGIGRYSVRPTVFTYTKQTAPSLLIKLQHVDAQQMAQINAVMQELIPQKDIFLIPYDDALMYNYLSVKIFRQMVFVCTGVSLLLAVIGLLGYINDQVNRRRKELAIRRINGATTGDLLRVFQFDLVKMALPALLVGGGLAYWLSRGIVEIFRDKITLSFPLFAGCGLAVLGFVMVITFFKTFQAAHENPVKNLKTE